MLTFPSGKKPMIKKVLKTPFVLLLLSFLASLYIRFVYWTSRWTLENFHIPQQYLKEGKPFLTCFWHGRLLMLPYGWPHKKHPFFMLISSHKDGVLISKTVGWFGIKTIAGSTNRGGREALLKIFRTLKKSHTVGITPDGPRGPYESISEGTIKIAQSQGIDILPISFSTSRSKIFRSWDRFFLALPFSRGIIAWGNPIHVQKDTLKEGQKKVQTALKELTQKLDQKVGHDHSL